MSKKLLIIVLIIALAGCILFGFLWQQMRKELAVQTQKVENLKRQINGLKQKIGEPEPTFREDKAVAVLRDIRIKTAMARARTIMSYIYAVEGNYDNFNCEYVDMKEICAEITENGGNIKIVHDSLESQKVCIYSPLNEESNYWYCADSRGVGGVTRINPNNQNYCGEKGAIICPPFSE